MHPIDQAVGFATFANGGVAHPPYFVQTATASDGEVVYQHKDIGHAAPSTRKVANDVTMTLEPIAAWSGVPLADGRPSAAKTGTEGIQVGKHAGGNSDAWMVGYTPQVVDRGVGRQRQLDHADRELLRRARVRPRPARADLAAVHGHLPGRQARAAAADQAGDRRAGADAHPGADDARRAVDEHRTVDAVDQRLDLERAADDVRTADDQAADDHADAQPVVHAGHRPAELPAAELVVATAVVVVVERRCRRRWRVREQRGLTRPRAVSG